MKKILFSLCLVAALTFVGCSEYDDSDIVAGLENTEDRLDALEDWQMTVEEELASIQTIIEALEANDYVTDVEEITSNGEVVGYTITFAQYGEVTITNGNDGADGEDGEAGSNGTNGQNGADGDSMFESVNVDTTNGYIEVVLSETGETYYIPMTTAMIIVDKASGNTLSGDFFYSFGSQEFTFTVSGLPDNCVAVNAKIMSKDGNVESTVVTREGGSGDDVTTGWEVSTAYENEVATITLTTPSSGDESAILKITAISSSGTETVTVVSILPASAGESASDLASFTTDIKDTTEDQIVSYDGTISGTDSTAANTIYLPSVTNGDVTINLTGGFAAGSQTLYITNAEDCEYTGDLYIAVDTDNSGTIDITLTENVNVYILCSDGSSVDVNNNGSTPVTKASALTYAKIVVPSGSKVGDITTAGGSVVVESGAKVTNINIENTEDAAATATIAVEGTVTNITSTADNTAAVVISTSGTADSETSTIGTVTNNATASTAALSVTTAGSSTVNTVTVASGVTATTSVETTGTSTVTTVTNNATTTTGSVSVTTSETSTVGTVAGSGTTTVDTSLGGEVTDAGDADVTASKISIGNTYYASIAAAIEKAGSGATIDLAAGVFTEDIEISNSITIKGAQAGTSGLNRSYDNNDGKTESVLTGTISVSGSAAEVTLNGLYFLEESEDYVANKIHVGAIKSLTVTNCLAYGITGHLLASSSNGTDVSAVKESVEISYNKFSGTKVSKDQSKDDNTLVYIPNVQLMTVTDNYFEGATRGVNLTVSTTMNSTPTYNEDSYGATITGNTFHNLSNYGVQTSYCPYGKTVINSNTFSSITCGENNEEEGAINIRGYESSTSTNTVLKYNYEIISNEFTNVGCVFLTRLYNPNATIDKGLTIGSDNFTITGNTISNVSRYILKNDIYDYDGNIDLTGNTITCTGDFSNYLDLMGRSEVIYGDTTYDAIPEYFAALTSDIGDWGLTDANATIGGVAPVFENGQTKVGHLSESRWGNWDPYWSNNYWFGDWEQGITMTLNTTMWEIGEWTQFVNTVSSGSEPKVYPGQNQVVIIRRLANGNFGYIIGNGAYYYSSDSDTAKRTYLETDSNFTEFSELTADESTAITVIFQFEKVTDLSYTCQCIIKNASTGDTIVDEAMDTSLLGKTYGIGMQGQIYFDSGDRYQYTTPHPDIIISNQYSKLIE